MTARSRPRRRVGDGPRAVRVMAHTLDDALVRTGFRPGSRHQPDRSEPRYTIDGPLDGDGWLILFDDGDAACWGETRGDIRTKFYWRRFGSAAAAPGLAEQAAAAYGPDGTP